MLDFVVSHSLDFAAIVIALVALGKAVSKVTPTKADDEFFSAVESAVEKVLGKNEQ